MNAVEIEEAISKLAGQPFDAEAFPFAFLEAFGNKATTIKRLRSGVSNRSDVGGVLQTNNIHVKVAEDGAVAAALTAMKTSPATARARAKFILATDGKEFHAEDLKSGEVYRLRLPGFPRPLRFLSATRGHQHGQANPRKRLRYQGDRTLEPSLCRTVERQPRVGHGGTSP